MSQIRLPYKKENHNTWLIKRDNKDKGETENEEVEGEIEKGTHSSI